MHRSAPAARRTLPLAACALLSGCLAGVSTRVAEPLRPGTPPPAGVVAVLPVTVEPGSEWLRPEIAEKLTEALAAAFPGTSIVGPDDAAQRLVDATLAGEYASLLADYDRAGVVDPARVDRVAEAVRASHLLQVRAGWLGQGVQRITTAFDGEPLVYSTEHQALIGVARLWVAGGRQPVWEAVVRAESEAGFLERGREPDDLLGEWVASVVERVPLERR